MDTKIGKNQKSFELRLGTPEGYFAFSAEIFQRLKQDTGNQHSFIYLLPVKRAVRQFTQQLIQQSATGVLASPPVFTFYEFLVQLYQELPDAKKVVSPEMSLFLVEEALRKNSAAGHLKFFRKDNATRRGLVRRVNDLITELREYGYQGEEFGDKWEPGDSRIDDFRILIQDFRAALGDELIDESGAMHELIDRLDQTFWQQHFPHVDTIYMSGYGLFTRPMQLFFEKARQLCGLKIQLDYLPEENSGQYPVFEHVHRAYEILTGLAPTAVVEKTTGPWEETLFRNDLADAARQPSPANILIQPASRRSEEVAFIANYVKRLHLSEGIPLHKIGITFPSLEKYAPLIHQIFPRYGVPYNISTGYQLDQSPLIRSFLLVLEVPLHGYDVKKLQQLLTSPFFSPLQKTSGIPSVNEAQIGMLARELRLNNFSGGWEKALRKKIAYLQQSIGNAQEDDEDRRKAERSLTAIEVAAEGLTAILEAFAALEKKMSAVEFRQRYLDLLDRFGMLKWYQRKNAEISSREMEQEYRAFNRFVKLLDQFSWIVGNVARGREQKIGEFHDYLSLLVAQATYNMREWPHYGLQIMPRLEVLSIEPQVLIFGGMLEGQFPRPYTQDVFFHDDEREELGLLATEDLLDQDRYLFYQILSAPTDRLVLTYPQFERDSAQVPSNFLNALADRFAVRWRRTVPSAIFLQNDRALIERVAGSIPAGLPQSKLIDLQRWYTLNRERRLLSETTAVWIERVLQLEEKKRPNFFGAYEGIIGGNPLVGQQLVEKYSHSAFSVTRLEDFAFCPIRFFFSYLMHLEEIPEQESGMTPLERGQFVHNTLFRFYRELRKSGQQDQPIAAAARLMEIAAEELDRLPFEGLFFELEKDAYLGGNGRRGLLEVYLEKEQESLEQFGFKPAYFELGFGRTGKKSEQDEASVDQPVPLRRGSESIAITGKIDRIDLGPDGQAMLIDYKTGNVPGGLPRRVHAGLTLQLPVYALVLQEIGTLGKNLLPVSPVLLALSQIRDPQNCGRKLVLADGEAGLATGTDRTGAVLPNKRLLAPDGEPLTFDQLLESTRDKLFEYRQSIIDGAFRHTRFPLDAGCASYCEFRRICRKDIRKLEQSV